MKYETLIVVGTIILVLLLPIIASVVIVSTPINAVADAIVSTSTDSKKVQLFDPDGVLVKEIEVSSTWPVYGPVTQEFGVPHWPYQETHTGIDIAANTGTPVTVFMEGRVIEVKDDGGGYGMKVVVDHGHNIHAIYAHLSAFATEVGTNVKPGDVIGEIGSTGLSEGPHLHLEMRVYDIPVNPRLFINGNPYDA